MLGILSVDCCILPGSNEWCSKSTINFKSDPLNLAAHCLLWACHRGVASLQPAVASHFSDHPPHPSPPRVSSCWWAELATHSRPCCSHWPAGLRCSAALRKCYDFNVRRKYVSFWCFPFLIFFSLDCASRARAGVRASRPLVGSGRSCRPRQPPPCKTAFLQMGMCLPRFPMETRLVQTLPLCALAPRPRRLRSWFRVDLTEVRGFHNQGLQRLCQ